MPAINPFVSTIETPPIPEAHAWAARYAGQHGPLLDMCQAVPGWAPHPNLLARAATAAADPLNARYGLIPGDLALREAYATNLSATYGGPIEANQTAMTAGCNMAFVATLMVLARQGDSILLPVPWFWNHQQSCAMLGIEPRPLPCRAENGFVPDPDDAAALIDGTTRAVVLISPNNPTGAVYPPDVIRRFFDLCQARGITLLLDETYRDFLPAGQARPHALFQHPGWDRNLIQLYSFSKAFSIPGHRLGAVAAAAPVLSEMTKVLDCLHICPNRGVQSVLAWAIPALQTWRSANRQVINARGDAVRAGFQGLPGWALESVGAYFAYVRHPFPGVPGARVAERLASEHGVVGLPGSAFGPGQHGHLRLAFANVPLEDLPEIIRRIGIMTP